jgi:allantoinase
MVRAFASNRVITPQGIFAGSIIVDNGVIVDLIDACHLDRSIEVRDFGDLVILPGLVDTHVHVNEPGRTHWEGFETATLAAAAGGITTIVDMPLNCLPATITVEALERKRSAAEGMCYVDWAAWAGITDDNHDHLLPLAAAGVRGYKCFLVDPGIDGLTRLTVEGLERAAPILAQAELPLLVHAESPETIEAATSQLSDADWKEYSTYLQSRPDTAEVDAIRLLIRLCRRFRFRVHIVHLATAGALEELDNARREGLPISVETCPHYLHFSAERIGISETLLKCAPPIRSFHNREGLWAGLQEGIIDLIASDHSPCPPEMKRQEEGDFSTAWGGIASLPLTLSVVWTGMKKRGIPLETISNWMARSPAALAGVSTRKGSIAIGMDSDFVVFDPEARFKVADGMLHYRHPISPYVGEELYGSVRYTFLRGEQIYGPEGFISPGKRMGAEIRLATE